MLLLTTGEVHPTLVVLGRINAHFFKTKIVKAQVDIIITYGRPMQPQLTKDMESVG